MASWNSRHQDTNISSFGTLDEDDDRHSFPSSQDPTILDPFASSNLDRQSTSYDKFTNGHNMSSGRQPESGSYSVYYDDDNDEGGLLFHDASVKNIPSAQNRNVATRMSGMRGLVDKAKGLAGYSTNAVPGSEMDLPLTQISTRKTLDDGLPQRTRRRRFDISSFKFGKSAPNPENMGPRVIHLNNASSNAAYKYVSNYVSTAKYNVATFLPKFLLEQFSKYANLFFLFTSVIQQFPGVSPTNRWTTIGPLTLVLIVSAFKELVEDLKRHNQDTELNRSKTYVLEGSAFVEKKWVEVRVGDAVRVSSEEPFPADLVLIASSEPEGLCYIETANLDGETNLKIKEARPETANLVSPHDLSRLTGKVRSEHPNNSLYTYEATLTLDIGGGQKEIPLNPDQLLLRGATLRNTAWIYGIVVFTGHESKLMRNATATPIKRTAVEKIINIQIIFLFAMLITLSLASSVGSLIRDSVYQNQLAYLALNRSNRITEFFLNILTFWILYSNLVPISLFVTVEVVKYYQAFLINGDLDMYYKETDTPAVCRTSSLVEELGQIEYIFSDKTGTLTCNMMQFRQTSIGGIAYADEVPEDRQPTDIHSEDGVFDFKRLAENLQNHSTKEVMHEFLVLLATCHTVIPERKDEKPDEIIYQAASPDEGALVEGAALLGYKFTTRRPKSVTINANGQELEYEVLNICEFNSTRKRMSAILRCPDGKVRIYCKGADTMILERLAKDNPYTEQTLRHLEDYATEGLRTLCLASREIPEDEYQTWAQLFEKAATTINNRSEELDKAAELIEKELFLLGATAIEDRLQDGVPDTIHTLQTAGIKIWVLTGDRQETAINIGMSCKLIGEDMSLIIINEESKEATREFISHKLSAIRCQNLGGLEMEALACVIDGKSLAFALERDLEKMFLDLAVSCKAVICCRVSPLQKALVVKLVKRHMKAILLAIGDGANDVSMIQAAHVGVGISGMEGLQAARSADVAIGQFRYLRKLLLVHGAWSYQRLSKLILYSFYKNIALYMTQFWFAFQNGFSGQVIYESWTITSYNVFFTVLPPFVIGVFDQFISARLLDRYPQLYQLCQKGVFFNVRSFWAWVLNGFYHSLILYLASILIFADDLIESNGLVAGQWVWGTTLYTAVLATVLGKAALVTNLWTKWTYLAIPGSLVLWLGLLPLYASIAPAIGFSTEYRGIVPHLYGSIVFWGTWIVLPVLCLLRDFAWKYTKRMYYPESYHHIQEIQKFNVADYRPRMEQFQKAIRKVRQVQRMRKQRGYAFSQADEGQARLIRAYDTTQSRGKYGEVRRDSMQFS
ncbi:putative phospholipid-transporting ATPase [Neolecta irregularis DAH-3]|uniref:Phospholipid-transporting ATPase n=1 Tax=Neolecta irregularis (strain DAH-3) TaxID=1198029 RepID=A0A1U7LMS2_NEOID|nr:putative phospholipid-transporting ATPase [Neolecta irregularis DAH-3]|eukprot:OLL23966.1 putative phospholipid-transporting ATPase [Neolecta irregularis DAH-3]